MYPQIPNTNHSKKPVSSKQGRVSYFLNTFWHVVLWTANHCWNRVGFHLFVIIWYKHRLWMSLTTSFGLVVMIVQVRSLLPSGLIQVSNRPAKANSSSIFIMIRIGFTLGVRQPDYSINLSNCFASSS